MMVMSAAAPGHAVIACLCSDGQVEFHASVCGCCSPNASHDDAAEFEPASLAPSCGECVDVQMHAFPAGTKPPHLATAATADADPAWSPCDAGRCASATIPTPLFDQQWRSLTLLAAVILLT